MTTVQDRYRGVILGVAVGDMVGLPVETASAKDVLIYFKALARLKRRFGLEEFLDPFEYQKGNKVFRNVGQVSDDTELTYALGQSLLACGEVNMHDLYARFRALVHGGAVSPLTGEPGYGWGSLTRTVLAFPSLEASMGAAGLPCRASNGSLMRTAPIALLQTHCSRVALAVSVDFASKVTHRHTLAGSCCVLYVFVLDNLLSGNTVNTAISDAWFDLEDIGEVHPWLRALKAMDPDGLLDNPGFMSGSAMHSLMVALWAIQSAPDFENGITEVVKLGGDTDTNAAIAGGLLGARFGYSGIPEDWRTGVMGHDKLLELADALYARSEL